METVGITNIKKFCNFYVSDVHLSVMLLPYLSKQINEDVKITTIFEELDKENIEKILDKLNVKNKEKLLKINWFNKTNNCNVNKEIEATIISNLNSDNKNIIIIGGKRNFILENNKKVLQYIEDNNNSLDEIKIINCYDINENDVNMKAIVENYDGILNTSGEMNI